MRHLGQVVDLIGEPFGIGVLTIDPFSIPDLSRARAREVEGPIIGDRKLHGSVVVEGWTKKLRFTPSILCPVHKPYVVMGTRCLFTG